MTVTELDELGPIDYVVVDREALRRRPALGEALDLEEPPERLECFDVSHTSGEATVASCVVFNAAGALKSDYRRFKIRTVEGADDYASLGEVLRRRLQRGRDEGILPEMILIDGGMGM